MQLTPHINTLCWNVPHQVGYTQDEVVNGSPAKVVNGALPVIAARIIARKAIRHESGRSGGGWKLQFSWILCFYGFPNSSVGIQMLIASL
jgi:hypothetical protein